MKKITAIPLSCLTAVILLSGCSGGTGSSSSEPPTLGPPERTEFREELPGSASYRRSVRRFDDSHFLYKNAEIYDDHDNMIRCSEVDMNTGDETVTRSYSYVYNEDGSVNEVCDYSYFSTRTLYTYNENGDPLTVEVFNVDTGEPDHTIVNEYNEHGDLVKSVKTDAYGKESLLSSSKYEYGDNGKASVKYEYYIDDTLKSTDNYSYDSENRLVTDECLTENSPVPRQVFTYEYDSSGNIILKTQTDYQPDGSVRTEAQLKSIYDQSGRIIKQENILNGSVNWYELYDYEDIQR